MASFPFQQFRMQAIWPNGYFVAVKKHSYAGNKTGLRALRQVVAAHSTAAMICAFECTFCRDCVEKVL
jgi:hypothetical protein